MNNTAALVTAAIHIPAVTAVTIADMQRGQHDAALVQYRDGSLDVIPSLAEEPVEFPTVVLRESARAWADDLVDKAREAAEAAGTSTHLQTLRKAAGLAATEVLRQEQIELAAAENAAAQRRAARRAAPAPVQRPVVATPPVLAPMRRPEPQTLREWSDLLDALDLLDRMGLQVVPAAA